MSQPSWYKVLCAAQLARYKAEIAFYCGEPEGDIHAIGAAMQAMEAKLSVLCNACKADLLTSVHHPTCPIFVSYVELFGMPEPVNSFEIPDESASRFGTPKLSMKQLLRNESPSVGGALPRPLPSGK